MRVQRTDCREPLLLSRYRQFARMTASKPFTWMRVQRRRSKFFAPREPWRLRRGRLDGGRYAIPSSAGIPACGGADADDAQVVARHRRSADAAVLRPLSGAVRPSI